MKDRIKETPFLETKFEQAKENVLLLLEHPLLPDTVKTLKDSVRNATFLDNKSFIQELPAHLKDEGKLIIKSGYAIALSRSPWNPIDRIIVRKSALKKDPTRPKHLYFPEEILIEEAMHLFCTERIMNPDNRKLIWRGFVPAYYIESKTPPTTNPLDIASEEARVSVLKTILIILGYGQVGKAVRGEVKPEDGFKNGCKFFYCALSEEQLLTLFLDSYPTFYFVPEYFSDTSNLKGKVNTLFQHLYSDSVDEFTKYLANYDKKYVGRNTKTIFDLLVLWYLRRILSSPISQNKRQDIDIVLPIKKVRESLLETRKIFGKDSYWIDTIK